MAAAKPLSETDMMRAISAPSSYRMMLIFGQDESAVHLIANNLCKKMGDMERVDIDSDKFKDKPTLLTDEVSSQSLFGDKRYIRLSMKRDEAVGPVKNLLEAAIAENLVIATAGNLTKASKLRKLAEASPQVAFHICYPLEAGKLSPQLIDEARSKGVKMDRALSVQIANNCNSNRALASIEIEKLALYYDADPVHNLVEAQSSDFEKLSADTADDNQFTLVNALMSGNIKKSAEEIVQARETGLNAISIIRAIMRRIILLAGMRSKVDNGMRPAQVLDRNYAVHWKEKEAVTVQLSTWTADRLASLNSHLLDLESNIMAARAEFTDTLLEQELMRICRAAARARRRPY